MDNAEAIPEPELRQRLTLLARIGQVCLHAQSGEYDAAVRVAAPLIAYSDAVYAKVRRLTPRQGALWTCLSQAQRQQGQFDQALKTLGDFIERCATTPLSPTLALGCEGEALIERALIELDTGRVADAQATIAERMAMSRETAEHRTYALAHGRVLLAGGEAAQAIEPLRRHHDEWAALQPDSPYTAEALYWLGRAHLSAGEARGRSMIEQARETLASSPVRSHRRLALRMTRRAWPAALGVFRLRRHRRWAGSRPTPALERSPSPARTSGRSTVEEALPVQVITREEIERSGATTLEQLLERVPANVNAFNEAQRRRDHAPGHVERQPARPGRRLDAGAAQRAAAGQLRVRRRSGRPRARSRSPRSSASRC